MYSVLLVDDEPLAIEGLQLFVDWEQLGFRVCGVCENGAEALSAARELLPDVIVTDIRMPEMDGLELIGRLKGERAAHAEFVVLSAYAEFTFAKRAIQLGVIHYLLKPVIGEEAAEVLRKVRKRLDARWTVRRRADGGEIGASLPAHAAQRLKDAPHAIRTSKPGSTMAVIDRYVREHYRSPLSIRDVATRFYLHPVYLGKAYQEKFGCGLLERMHDLRIAEACEKLRGTTESIGAIAEQVGYSYYRHFLQHFERRTGKKPAEFRASEG